MVDEPEPLTSLPQGTTTNLCIKTFQCDFFFLDRDICFCPFTKNKYYWAYFFKKNFILWLFTEILAKWVEGDRR